MNRYTNLTGKELSELTDEQVKRYIDIEIIYNQIIPMEKPTITKPCEPTVEQTVVAYEFAGMIFESQEDAAKVATMTRFETTYINNMYNYKYLSKSNDFYGVKTVKFYSKENLMVLKDEIEHYNTLTNKYDNDWKEYNDYEKEISSIKNNVWSAINEAKDNIKKVKSMASTYEKYLDLSEGDKDIAWNFLKASLVKQNSSDEFIQQIKDAIDN